MPPQMTGSTESKTGQGSGILAEVSGEVGIEGSAHFERSALYGGLYQ